jgi:hypothetical protein
MTEAAAHHRGSGPATGDPAQNPSALTGFTAPVEVQVGHPASAGERSACSDDWMSDELVAEHCRVLSRKYRRIVTEQEAKEIIMNIRRFAEAVIRAIEEEEST